MVKHIERLKDEDFRKAEKAMKRAAQDARERAKRFGHGVVVMKDGKVVELKLDD